MAKGECRMPNAEIDPGSGIDDPGFI